MTVVTIQMKSVAVVSVYKSCGDSYNNNCYCLVKFCTDGEYQCHSGDCIPNDYVCDGDNDCGGWEDEENCTNGN